ncbi:hypothetical protein K458DRAFT_394282 [Lentithecium fluviatile CBS 122367]|uniref:Kinesin light chain n=1 Tax=Lentithecium fluviatile CBS 122367 TaxID=1168545 RepID=A0A6G1ILN6_9PLEO|nr:hypothetical protein K458DRAFT_394282 [Lentithecium fluviatile CBS 122367]
MHVVDMPEVHEAEGWVSLLDRLGYCELSLGRYNSAEAAHRKVFEQRESMLGKEHPDTLKSMGNLALMYTNQGRWKEAEELEVQVLETRKRVLGEEHPGTLTSMGNLAHTWKDFT